MKYRRTVFEHVGELGEVQAGRVVEVEAGDDGLGRVVIEEVRVRSGDVGSVGEQVEVLALDERRRVGGVVGQEIHDRRVLYYYYQPAIRGECEQ